MRPAAVLAVLALAACGAKKDVPPPLGGAVGAGGSAGTGGSSSFDAGSGPPPADAGGLCGNLIVPVVIDRPNLYFVLDRSGSMADPLPGSAYSKYLNAKLAIRALLEAVGYRVAYGAAVFPDPAADQCAPGAEVFSTRVGDPASYTAAGTVGPVLYSLMSKLAKYTPNGGTPTSATLEALAPTIEALPGHTHVILATDGAPNCDAAASCTADGCQLNLDHYVLPNGQACNSTFNCCDPANVVDGQTQCVDGDATEAAVAALEAAGIDTYVIGMPGSELYAGVLDKLAVAGNTARAAEPKYYATSNTTELTDALKQIGFSVAISCDITLDQKPPDKNLVNVYFDASVVPYDETDGWKWTGDSTLSITGPACDKLKSGAVLQVQVVAGCPTQVR